MKNIRLFFSLVIILFAFSTLLGSDKLNMFIDYNRFLDKNKNTILLLDYQIPYENLAFLATNNGYFAELNVKVKITEADSIFLEHEINDIIGVKNKADTGNRKKSYLNRLSFTLHKPLYTIQFSALDINSQKNFFYEFQIETLPPSSLLSDIELNSEVKPDTSQYLVKFKRNNVLYRSEPSILFNKSINDYIYLYLEIYNWNSTSESCLLNLSLEKDSLVVMDEYIDFQPGPGSESINLKIPLKDLNPGFYNGTIVLQSAERTEERNIEFAVIEEKEEEFFLFANPDEEYELMRIFLGNKIPSDWGKMNQDTKRRYITQFWRDMAFSTNRSVQSIMDLVQKRIDYANRNFTHFKQGWTSDMGRIYIRNGPPDDIQRDTSSDESRFVRKDYQIWKYVSGKKPVYMFIDIQMNGNYRLIYVENDDLEASNPDWMRYVGSDFDTSKLDN
ncbi:MAG TPA: GWxTD domain-containing protein [Candidatus Cloacimonas acidaminovorans]|nr:GWxTD domain-containing protein [Candidatus Cloacimonas sp.]NLM89702.1 GWxTD domain-containing protein [Candidatus Cloacimonadota bacterium]HNV61679.1 GWxTD domain-containing protein [Candidatus Cloacimonas acidaminovorans]HPI42351.1 GWxTD domain-containing protein [Candidatus Cloacimonas acidaminovorans]HPU99471.1 GWxTD domain-containing protein [Candidatus Cloacimonas acidaminovorans]